MGGISFEFRSYRRRFRTPLRTAWGEWRFREGFLVKVIDEAGRIGFGEAAPPPWRAAESIEAVEAYLSGLNGVWKAGGASSATVPPCCRFALESAIAQARGRQGREEGFEAAALLPAGEAALETMEARRREGFRVFKWKVGVAGAENERAVLQEMLRRGEGKETFRIDANGGLDPDEAVRWIECLAAHPNRIEFFEQPLPRGAERELFELARRSPVAIALDESVTTFEDFQEMTGKKWPGVYVIKPAWLGRWNGVAEELAIVRSRLVFSSGMETSIGIENALRLAAEAGKGKPAVGFGVLDLFENDGLTLHSPGPRIQCGRLTGGDLHRVWENP